MAEKQSIYYVKPFDGSGFANWEFRIKLLLEQQGVLEVLTTPMPASSDPEHGTWKKNNTKAKMVIVQSLADNMLDSVKQKTDAKEMMDTLASTYTKKGISNQVMLQKKLRSLKYTEGTQLHSFFTEFNNTLSELKAAGGNIDDNEVILQLLSAMPDCFQNVTTAIDIMFCQNQTAVDISFVKNKLLMEEARQLKKKDEEGTNTVFLSKYNKRGGWRKPGAYRGNHNNPGNASQSGNFPFKCHLCNQTGHKRAECPQNKYRNSEYNGNYSGNYHLGHRGSFRGNRGGSYSHRNNANNIQEASTEQIEEDITFLSSEDCLENAVSSNTGSDMYFVVDSGATNHLITEKFGKYIQESNNVLHKINVAKQGQTITAKIQGNLKLQTETGKHITVKDVWVCDNLLYNLLSVRKLEENGFEVVFSNKKVTISKNGVIILEGVLKGNLYYVHFKINQYKPTVNMTSEEKMLLHRRMGHSVKYPAPCVCEVCVKSKQTRLPFVNIPQERKANRILEMVSTDICGPISPTTYDGKSYFISFIDHFSHFCVIFLLSNKSEALSKFKNYVSMVEAKFNLKIEKLRCDNGGEYTSHAFKDFCREKGIRIQYTVAYNPEQNGVAERFNRTVMERARSLIFDSKLEKDLWGEAVRTGTYLINRTETRTLENNKTPVEIWNNEKPNLNKIKLFGCTAYNLIPKEVRKSKLDSRSEKLKMVGYADNGYRLWNENQRKIVIGRNVIFDEKKRELDNQFVPIEYCENDEEPEAIPRVDEESDMEENDQTIQENRNIEEQRPRRSTRRIGLPHYLNDYDLSDEVNFFAALSAGNIFEEVPRTYTEAVEQGWKEAINEELDALEENKTWILVVPPQDVETIDSKWVFSKKVLDGQVKQKARLVARGYKQSVVLDDVYAPVARMASIRLLLSLYIEYDLHCIQLDVKSAFLNGILKEPVYMLPPEGLKIENQNLVCKLEKALYGLRQSPKCWNSLFNSSLLNLGFKRSNKDSCFYFFDKTYLLIHVDDIILFSDSLENLNYIKNSLSEQFKMNEFGNTKINFLGLEIEKFDHYIYIQQTNLINKILQKFNMTDSKPHDIPMQPKFQLNFENNLPICDKTLLYRELIGSLMYIMLGTRPDLSFSISYFSQFQNCYTSEHWKYLKHTLKYLNKTKNYGLKFTKSNCQKINFSAYVDSDFANDIKDRKSISGFLIKFNNNIIEWKTRKQNVVALSSAESEYLALSSCVSECLFLGQMCSEILNCNIFPISIFEDNQSCIKMASTMETKRTKHIDVRHHFVRECVAQEKIVLSYVPTEKQQADILTKPLANPKFKYFRECLNVVEILKTKNL